MTRTPDAATEPAFDLFDALDLPPELRDLQNAYWEAKREWIARDAAYHRVLKDMLDQVEGR